MMPITETLDEFRKDYRYFDVRRIEPFTGGIVVCLYSHYYETGICDSSKCPGTEEKEVKELKELDSIVSKLALYKCPSR